MKASRRFQPGEGPIRGLLRNCESSFEALVKESGEKLRRINYLEPFTSSSTSANLWKQKVKER